MAANAAQPNLKNRRSLEGWLQLVMPILRVSAFVASRRSGFSAVSGPFGS